jgi:hypothetical protein
VSNFLLHPISLAPILNRTEAKQVLLVASLTTIGTTGKNFGDKFRCRSLIIILMCTRNNRLSFKVCLKVSFSYQLHN